MLLRQNIFYTFVWNSADSRTKVRTSLGTGASRTIGATASSTTDLWRERGSGRQNIFNNSDSHCPAACIETRFVIVFCISHTSFANSVRKKKIESYRIFWKKERKKMVRKRTKKRCFIEPVTDHKLKIIHCANGAALSTLSPISVPESLAAQFLKVFNFLK